MWHPTDIYQACVLVPETAQAWIKIYPSKADCITELRCIEALSPDEADQALADAFDILDRVLIINGHIDPGQLRPEGFDEVPRRTVNQGFFRVG